MLRGHRVCFAVGLFGVLCTASAARALCAQQGSAKPDSATMFNEAMRLSNAGEALDVFAVVDSQRKALALLRQAEPLFRLSGARVHLLFTQYSIAQRYFLLGSVDTAESYASSSLGLARAMALQEQELPLLVLRGQFRDLLRRPDSALADFLEARNLGVLLGKHDNDRRVDLGLAHSYFSLEKPDSALIYYRAAVTAPGDSTLPGQVADAYNGVGATFANLGQADSAITNYRRAMAIRHRLGDRGTEARILQNIGQVFDNIGQPDSSLVYHRQALPVEREGKDRKAEATTMLNIGGVLNHMGMQDSSLAYFRLALPIFREVGDRQGESRAAADIAGILSRMGATDSAIPYYRSSLAIAREIGDRYTESTDYINLTYLLTALGVPDSALWFGRQAVANARGIGDPALEADAMVQLGRTFGALHRPDSASWYLERSTVLSASLSQLAGNDFNQQHFNEDHQDVFALWSLTMLDALRLGDTVEAIPAALAIAERGRAQALLHLMGDRRELHPGVDLVAEGDSLAELATAHASGALVYSVAGDSLLIWLLVPKHTYATVVPVPPGRLEALVAGLRYGVAQEDAIAERGGHITRGASTTLDPLDSRLLTPEWKKYALDNHGRTLRGELSQYLLPTAITDHLPVSGELLIIPQGSLGLLPFGLLSFGQDSALLGDHFALRYGPSLTAVAQAEARPGLAAGADRATGLAPALIVGDPAMPAPFALDGERYAFDPLPSARLEGKAVADSLGASQWLTGSAASESAVRAAIPDARLIHLATHGLVYSSDAHSRLSFVALAPDATHDGHLSVAKIIDSLTFKAELVVLSACQTAVGNVTSSEGTLGLQRAVLAKGARSVLVSLWNVPDESTLFLIERFYHHWLRDPGAPSKSEALRLAQADVRAEASRNPAHKAWADPFYWAAFQLVGAP